MKKKLLFFALIIAMLFGTTGCGELSFEVDKAAMCNSMQYNQVAVHDGWLYGSFDNPFGFGMVRCDSYSDDESVNMIKQDYIADYLTFGEEYLFFTLQKNGELQKTADLYRCRFGGTDLKKIVSGYVSSIQVIGDKLYYTNGDGLNKINKFCSCDLDGKNEEVIFEKGIYFPYITGDYLFYQDDADGESLHMYSITEGEDVKLTENHCWNYCIDGNSVYYCGNKERKDDDYGVPVGNVIKLDINTMEETVLIEKVYGCALQITDDSIYYINRNDSNRLYCADKEGKNIKLISSEKDCINCFIFDDTVYYTNISNGYLAKLYSCEFDGKHKNVIVDYTK